MTKTLFVINSDSNIIENSIVPPQGADVYFVPAGYHVVEGTIDDASIGWSYIDGRFIDPAAEPDPVPETDPDQD